MKASFFSKNVGLPPTKVLYNKPFYKDFQKQLSRSVM